MKRLQAVFTSLMITAGAAQAADIYGGIALDYGMPHSGDTVQHGTILMGARLPSLSGYFAAEADIGANFGGADYSTLRARGIYGTSFGQITGFGSLGVQSTAVVAHVKQASAPVSVPKRRSLETRACAAKLFVISCQEAQRRQQWYGLV